MKTIIVFILIIIQLVLGEKECFKSRFKDENGNCVGCPSGYFCDGVTKKECPDGYYSSHWQTECKKCGCNNCSKTDIIGKHGKPILHSAGSCPPEEGCYPGYGIKGGTDKCLMCYPGSYSEGGRHECRVCPPWSISTEYGSTSCQKCPDGMGRNRDSTECVKCPPGRYINEIGYCNPCPNQSVSNEWGSTECIKCKSNEHANNDRTECLPGPVKRKIAGPGRYELPTAYEERLQDKEAIEALFKKLFAEQKKEQKEREIIEEQKEREIIMDKDFKIPSVEEMLGIKKSNKQSTEN